MQPSVIILCVIQCLALFLYDVEAIGCPNGWTAGPSSISKCYKVYKEHRTWMDAEAQCKTDGGSGGHLVSIHNAFENNFLLTFVVDNGITFDVGMGFLWTGLNNINSTVLTNYKWVDGSALTYTNWYIGDQIHQAHPEVDSCVGFFISTLPNSGDISGTWTAGPTRAHIQPWPFICQTSPI